MSDPRPFDQDDIARHARFLRGLAGSLVADPGHADDAVQEAWLAALRRRPDASRPLEPWLARVVRNTLGRLRRGEARRLDRERRAARPEAQSSAQGLAERAVALRRLLDEVLTLPEDEREAVLLRWYEALAPRRIAERLGVPVELIYRRLERALERLRARLTAADPRPGAWRLGLVGALGLPRELLGPAYAAAGTGAAATATAAAVSASAPSLAIPGALLMASSTTSFTFVAVALGAGLGLGWLGARTFDGGADAPAQRRAPVDGEPVPHVTPGSASGPTPALEASEVARLEARYQAQVKDLERKNAELSAALESQKQALAAATPPPLDAKALRFGLAGPTPVFDGADWAALAGHVSEMAKIMPQLSADLAAGRELSPDIQQGLQEHNTPLASFAVAASRELKGTGPNGAYTHPAVIANLIRSGLLAANDPLTPAQEQAIVTLGNAWVSDVERSLAALSADAPALASTIVEVDAKQRFLDAVKAQLTGTQRAVLFHPETEGRLGLDLLSPALVYMLHTGVYGATPAEVATKLVDTALKSAGAKDVDAAALAGVGERWLSEIPGGSEPRAMRDTETMFPTSQAMQACARAHAAAIQRLADSGRLTPDQVLKLKRVTTLLVPQVLAPQ